MLSASSRFLALHGVRRLIFFGFFFALFLLSFLAMC
jgi:hypothetical protein